MEPGDFVEPTVPLWACNAPAVELFSLLSTQWRAGPSGVIGLDYNVVFHELDRKGIEGEAYDEIMGSIRVIEDVALEEMRNDDG